jgi:hypothetical protein
MDDSILWVSVWRKNNPNRWTALEIMLPWLSLREADCVMLAQGGNDTPVRTGKPSDGGHMWSFWYTEPGRLWLIEYDWHTPLDGPIINVTYAVNAGVEEVIDGSRSFLNRHGLTTVLENIIYDWVEALTSAKEAQRVVEVGLTVKSHHYLAPLVFEYLFGGQSGWAFRKWGML